MRRAALLALLLLTPPVVIETAGAQSPSRPTLADASDRAAFRQWFTLLAELQFERPTPLVTDCASLVRHALSEALRPHTPEWVRHLELPFAPRFPDVHGGPKPTASGWPLFRVTATPPGYAEFANARTIIRLNARPIGRDPRGLQPGDLVYYQQPQQSQPDHLMVFVGRSHYDDEGDDWVVYHTGPDGTDPGEVRKVRLTDLARHPAARWRPLASNPQFIGFFRLWLV